MTPQSDKTLLERALANPSRKALQKLTPEEVELIVAWLQGKVSTGQCTMAMGWKGSHQAVSARWVYRVSSILRNEIMSDRIELVMRGGRE